VKTLGHRYLSSKNLNDNLLLLLLFLFQPSFIHRLTSFTGSFFILDIENLLEDLFPSLFDYGEHHFQQFFIEIFNDE
jgi:hypothetical protein